MKVVAHIESFTVLGSNLVRFRSHLLLAQLVVALGTMLPAILRVNRLDRIHQEAKSSFVMFEPLGPPSVIDDQGS